MLPRVLIACAILVIVATPLFAEDATPKTSIHVYRVGDLVSYNSLPETVVRGMVRNISPKEWCSEHTETIESLDCLASLVRAMCGTKATTVESHRGTLSLVVRHTADGHQEIEQLLNELRMGNEPSIQVTYQLIISPKSPCFQSLPQEKRKLATELLSKKVLTPDEAREARDLLAIPEVELPEYLKLDQTPLQLVAGRKAYWGIDEYPAAMTACIVPGKHSIQLRVDYVADDIGDTIPVESQVFDIQDGFSTISLHTCDGATLAWLITPTIIEPAAAANARLQMTATK